MSDPASVVCVHGAWGGGWMFDGLVAALAKRGVRSIAVDLPTCSADDTSVDLHTDAAHVRSVVDAQVANGHGPVVLVGNSYGGAVITEAAAGSPDVKRLVYLAAAMPAPGEPLFQVLNEASAPEFGAGIQFLDDGRLRLDPEVAVLTAFQQATTDDHERWRRLGSRAMSFGADLQIAVAAAAWEQIPSTYVVCSDDRAIKPELQLQWAKERATDFVEVPFDHCPHISHPDEIAELIGKLAVDASG